MVPATDERVFALSAGNLSGHQPRGQTQSLPPCFVQEKNMTEFSIENVGSRIDLRIGPDPCGYSCTEVSIEHGRIATGSTNQPSTGTFPVWTFEYERFPWRVVVTDAEIIGRIKEQDKSYWMRSLIDATLQAAIDNQQLRWLIEKTIEITAKREFQDGRLRQAKDTFAVLGLPGTPRLADTNQ
jgi:hypothetical protein